MEVSKNVSRFHRGIHYSAPTQERIDKLIEDREFEQSVFHRSNVYTYSCYARLLKDGRVEFKQYYNNGETDATSYFSSKDAFYNREQFQK